MPLELPHDRSVIIIRQDAYERSGISRVALDERFNLTPDEFQVQEALVVLGPLASDTMLTEMITELENNGLVYFDDFFELTGNWPDWLTLYVRGLKTPTP
ncbi:MAG: hypothetical protein ACREMS_12610 [Gemmatimonadaceae bacterium]